MSAVKFMEKSNPGVVGRHAIWQTEFDPANVDHRRRFAEFMANNGWGAPCPFLLEKPYVNVPDLCREKLLQWYMNKDRFLKT